MSIDIYALVARAEERKGAMPAARKSTSARADNPMLTLVQASYDNKTHYEIPCANKDEVRRVRLNARYAGTDLGLGVILRERVEGDTIYVYVEAKDRARRA